MTLQCAGLSFETAQLPIIERRVGKAASSMRGVLGQKRPITKRRRHFISQCAKEWRKLCGSSSNMVRTVKPRIREGSVPLNLAAEAGYGRIVRLLLANEWGCKRKELSAGITLYRTVELRRVEVVKSLSEKS